MHRSSAALLFGMAVVLVAVQVPSAQVQSPSVVYVTPNKINWKPVPAGLPPGAQIAVLVGDPASDGPFVLRLKMPDGYKIAPHRHPVTETTTVISGELRVGIGDTWDTGQLQSLTSGSLVSIPPGQSHFAMAHGETVIQTQGVGPFKRVYVNPADDPAKK
ncbi:MAG TPA: cupin domain-containing protein [Candidatus Angelobacter sp.]|nr:cupin domain-containing protein [Candidatus Angelobacter sp.]